jgi:hypothetical protein
MTGCLLVERGEEIPMQQRFKHKVVSSVARHQRFSPLMLVGLSVPVALALIASAVFILPRLSSHAAAVNGNCTLIVPARPLSAEGLTTPYQLVATDAANGPCNEANKTQAAFVQGAVIDPASGRISIYNPLVIDQGTQPAAVPVVPKLPANGVVALWFGFNGNNLTLQGTNGSLRQGRCVNGANGSIFGQFAYCNAPAFFRAANRAIQAGLLNPPALGTANDGQTCPSVRDFGLVDMDQSDNVVTSYLVTANGQTAQATAANMAALQNSQMQVNGSDNRLLAIALDGALGCNPWKAPDLADPGQMVAALPLDELQAAAQQAAPVALVPAGDPMVLNNNQPDLNKVNAYRRGVDQSAVGNLDAASTTTYCQHLLATGPARIQLDMQLTQGQASPDPAAANSLFTFLAQRFVASFGANGLNCVGLLNMPDPIAVTNDGNGVAISATFNAGGNNNGGGNNNNGGNNNTPTTGGDTTPTVGASATPPAPTTSPTANPTTDPGMTPTPTTGPAITPTPQDTSPSPTPTPQDTSPSPTPTPQDTSPSPTPTPQDISPSPTPTPQDTSPSPTPTPQDTSPSPTPTPQDISPSPTTTPQDTSPSPTTTPQDTSPSPTPTANPNN